MKILRAPLVALLVPFAILATARADCSAQSKQQLKKELKTRVEQAGENHDTLVEIAKWARDKGMDKDAEKLLEGVLDAAPDHEGARAALGFVKFDGEWVTSAKAEVLRAKAADAAMKAKGLVKVEDVWVEKDKVRDAKKGIFWHEGKQVTIGEKRALILGMVRHPRTGRFIPADELEQAKQDLFRSDDGRWLTLSQANEYHSDRDHPWMVRTENATILSTLPLEKIEEYAVEVENGIGVAKPIFLGNLPGGAHRPVVWIAPDVKAYQEVGSAIGDGESAYGAFHAIGALALPDLGEVRPTVCHQDGDRTLYYVRHAGALAVAHGMLAQHEDMRVPAWFPRAVGGLAERFLVPEHATWFAKQHVGKGGVKDLKTWFNSFSIDPGMDPKAIGFNVFQAGLVVHFAMNAGNEKCLEAMQAVSEAVVNDPKKAKKAFKAFEKALTKAEDELREHLRGLAK